jgi:hypothetical protein
MREKSNNEATKLGISLQSVIPIAKKVGVRTIRIIVVFAISGGSSNLLIFVKL